MRLKAHILPRRNSSVSAFDFIDIMRAVRFHGARDIRLDEIEEPVCGVDQVKVRQNAGLPPERSFSVESSIKH